MRYFLMKLLSISNQSSIIYFMVRSFTSRLRSFYLREVINILACIIVITFPFTVRSTLCLGLTFSEGTVHPHIVVMWVLYYHSTSRERDQTLLLHRNILVVTQCPHTPRTMAGHPVLFHCFVYACANATVSWLYF